MSVKAAAYIRRSTKHQDLSLSDQLAAIRKYAEERDYEIISVFEDDGQSATSPDRVDFQKMMSVIMSGKCPFSYVIVYSLNRFSRMDVLEAHHHLYLLKQNNVKLAAITEGLHGDYNLANSLLNTIHLHQSREYSLNLSKVTTRGNLSTARLGRFNGGREAYGYRRAEFSKEDKYVRTLNPYECKSGRDCHVKYVLGSEVEQATVKEIFDCYVNRFMSIDEIVDMLNQKNTHCLKCGEKICSDCKLSVVPAPSNRFPDKNGVIKFKPWSKGSIFSILRNEVYTGCSIYDKRPKKHSLRRELDETMNKGYYNNPAKWIRVENCHPAIIDNNTFLKALSKGIGQDKLYKKIKSTDSPFLLTSLFRCECGGAMYGNIKRRETLSGKQRVYYSYECCVYHRKATREKCVSPKYFGVHRNWLEYQVVKNINETITNPNMMERTSKIIDSLLSGEGKEGDNERNQLKQEIEIITEQLNRFIDNFTKGTISFEDKLMQKKYNELTRKKEMLERELAAYSIQEGKLPITKDTVIKEILKTIEKFSEVFHSGTLQERKRILQLFVHKVTALPERKAVEIIYYQIPNIIPVSETSGNVGAEGAHPKLVPTDYYLALVLNKLQPYVFQALLQSCG